MREISINELKFVGGGTTVGEGDMLPFDPNYGDVFCPSAVDSIVGMAVCPGVLVTGTAAESTLSLAGATVAGTIGAIAGSMVQHYGGAYIVSLQLTGVAATIAPIGVIVAAAIVGGIVVYGVSRYMMENPGLTGEP